MPELKKLTPELSAKINDNLRKIQALNAGQYDQDKRPEEIISKIIDYPVPASTNIRLPFYTDSGVNIKIGKNVFINVGITLVDLGGITIEDDVMVGPWAKIISVNHPTDPHKRRDPRNTELEPVHIKKNAWIGSGATILPGITIGENSIVGAESVVTHDVPDNTIVVGNPARVLKKL